MQNTSVRHAINLPYIEQFFNGSELLAETTDLLDFIPQILLPNLTFQKYETDNSAGLLRESLFSMQEFAQSAINDSQIFLDLGDLIAEQLEKNKLDLDHQTFSIKTIETILIFLNPILVVCLIVGFAKIYWKFRTITAALLILRPQGASTAITSRKVFVPNRWRTPYPVVAKRKSSFHASNFETDRISGRCTVARDYGRHFRHNSVPFDTSLHRPNVQVLLP
jgi:hypothetical protein